MNLSKLWSHNFAFKTTNLRHAACNTLFIQFRKILGIRTMMFSNDNDNEDDNEHDGDENDECEDDIK